MPPRIVCTGFDRSTTTRNPSPNRLAGSKPNTQDTVAASNHAIQGEGLGIVMRWAFFARWEWKSWPVLLGHVNRDFLFAVNLEPIQACLALYPTITLSHV